MVAADDSWASPVDSNVFLGVFGVHWELVGAPRGHSTDENEKNMKFPVAAHESGARLYTALAKAKEG